MAVRIRLKRMGKVRAPYYRIVVCDSRNKRDGRVIEEIGTYNPKTEPSLIHVESERAQHWLGVGAQPSTPVAAILKLTGDWQRFKGEPGESTLRHPEPKRDKTEIFNEALTEAHGESRSEAVTKKSAKPDKSEKTDRKPDAKTDAKTDATTDSGGDQPKAEDAQRADGADGADGSSETQRAATDEA